VLLGDVERTRNPTKRWTASSLSQRLRVELKLCQEAKGAALPDSVLALVIRSQGWTPLPHAVLSAKCAEPSAEASCVG